MKPEVRFFRKILKCGGRVQYIINYKKHYIYFVFPNTVEVADPLDEGVYIPKVNGKVIDVKSLGENATNNIIESSIEEILSSCDELNGDSIPTYVKDFGVFYSKNKERRGSLHEQKTLPLLGVEVDEKLVKLLSIFNDPKNYYYAPTAFSCQGESFSGVLGQLGYIMFTEKLDDSHPIIQKLLNSGYGVRIFNGHELHFNNNFGYAINRKIKIYHDCMPNEFRVERKKGHAVYGEVTVIRWGFKITVDELEKMFS